MAKTKTDGDSRNNGAYAVARSDYKRKLIIQWVSEHRPDVIEASKEEAFKKFPSRSKNKVALPEKLASLKQEFRAVIRSAERVRVWLARVDQGEPALTKFQGKEPLMKVEVNSRFVKANDTTNLNSGHTLMITPPLDENYWAFRVPLKHGQSIVVFPKFGTFGCGFAIEKKDWNTNLPLQCRAEEIYSHIKCNKGHRDISDEECITAIKSLQEFVYPQKGQAHAQ